MNYVTADDLIARFGQSELDDVAGDGAGGLDAARIDTAAAAASRLIDSYLRQRMSVPVDPVPDVLVDAAADIARFKLHDDEPSDEIKERYKVTVAWLKDVVAGKASLGADDATTTPSGRVVHGQGRSGFDWGTHVV